MKSFSKYLSFGVDFKLQVPLLMYKNNTHHICGVRNQVNNPDLKGCNGVYCDLRNKSACLNKVLRNHTQWSQCTSFIELFIVLNRGPIKKCSHSNSLQSDDCLILHEVGCSKLMRNGLIAINAAFQSHDCCNICQL